MVRFKPSHPTMPMPQVPSSDAVPRRTDRCQAMPAAARSVASSHNWQVCNNLRLLPKPRTPPRGLSNTHPACRAEDLPSPAVAAHDQRTRNAKVKMVLQRRRLSEGYEGKGAAVARPRSEHGFHLKNPRA
jgi:hypothetical protein